MLQVGFEPTIPVFVRGETIYALDRSVTVMSILAYIKMYYPKLLTF
jgi:hypothetical protein